jgi:hypothetical protein
VIGESTISWRAWRLGSSVSILLRSTPPWFSSDFGSLGVLGGSVCIFGLGSSIMSSFSRRLGGSIFVSRCVLRVLCVKAFGSYVSSKTREKAFSWRRGR